MTRYTVALVPGDEGFSASVPAIPGCVTQGRTRDETIAHDQEAMGGWMIAESKQGRGPLEETPSVVSAGVEEVELP